MVSLMPSGPMVSLEEFERIFESVKNWGRWGPDDQLGTLNYITPEKVRAAAGLVRSGRRASMEIPINTVAGPDNPNPAIHLVSQAHDIDIGSHGLRFGLDYLGMACHGDCHSHVDALCHISYKGVTYNGLFNALGELDFGPGVSHNRGIITNWGHPPVLAAYHVLVPRENAVGIDRGGLELPVVGVPTATLTGWNYRRAPYADGELCELNGSYLPLPVTKADATAAGDPRPSLQELYGTHEGYVKAVKRFVRKSVKERYLLPADAAAAVQDAEASDVLVGVGP